MAKIGSPTNFASSRKIPTKLRASTLPINPASIGIYGSPRSATGAPTPSSRALKKRLLEGTPDVLALFANNPFPQPPRQIRVLLWQYWFTSMQEKREQGLWWRRQLLGNYAPTLGRDPNNRIIAIEWPPELPPRQ